LVNLLRLYWDARSAKHQNTAFVAVSVPTKETLKMTYFLPGRIFFSFGSKHISTHNIFFVIHQSINWITTFTQIQDEVFPEIWHFNIWGHLKFMYEVSTGPQLTRSLWTGPCRAKPRPALPNCDVRSTLFWVIMRHRVVIPYRPFRTTCQSHLPGSTNQKERTEHDCFNGYNIF